MDRQGLADLGENGSLQLTSFYNVLRNMFAEIGTDNWLSGVSANQDSQPMECSSNIIPNAVLSYKATTITLASDWALSTKPPGLDKIISEGANGERGQMVDVTVIKCSSRCKIATET